MIRVLDFATTPTAAYRLLGSRVVAIDRRTDLYNAIVCPPGVLTERLRVEGVRVIELEMSRALTLFGIIGETVRLYRLLCRRRPDIIHTHNSKAGGVVRIAAWLYRRLHFRRLIVVHQVHGFYFNRLVGVRRLLYEYIERILALISDVLLFQNRTELEYARRRMAARLLFIGNGVHLGRFASIVPRRAPAVEGIWTIVCVARLEPVKNHIELLRALGCLKQTTDTFRALLIGEAVAEHTAYFKTLQTLCADLGLQEQVEFCGMLDHDQVIGHLQRADVAVLASSKEGLPRALIEAMLCAIPCVATDVVGTNEVIRDGETGFLVPLGNPQCFAQAIVRLMQDDNLWVQMARTSLAVAREQFNEERIINWLVALYRRLKIERGELHCAPRRPRPTAAHYRRR